MEENNKERRKRRPASLQAALFWLWICASWYYVEHWKELSCMIMWYGLADEFLFQLMSASCE